jgi:hypothetical protein
LRNTEQTGVIRHLLNGWVTHEVAYAGTAPMLVEIFQAVNQVIGIGKRDQSRNYCEAFCSHGPRQLIQIT